MGDVPLSQPRAGRRHFCFCFSGKLHPLHYRPSYSLPPSRSYMEPTQKFLNARLVCDAFHFCCFLPFRLSRETLVRLVLFFCGSRLHASQRRAYFIFFFAFVWKYSSALNQERVWQLRTYTYP